MGGKIFPKPLPTKGDRRRLGLLSQCLVLVVGVSLHPPVFSHPHAGGVPSRRLPSVTLSFELAKLSSPVDVAS